MPRRPREGHDDVARAKAPKCSKPKCRGAGCRRHGVQRPRGGFQPFAGCVARRECGRKARGPQSMVLD